MIIEHQEIAIEELEYSIRLEYKSQQITRTKNWIEGYQKELDNFTKEYDEAVSRIVALKYALEVLHSQ